MGVKLNALLACSRLLFHPSTANGDVNNYQAQNCVPKENNLSHLVVCSTLGAITLFSPLLIIKIIKRSHSDALKGHCYGFGIKGLGCVNVIFYSKSKRNCILFIILE